MRPAAKLLNKCKRIVKSINHSNPLLYDVRQFQEELNIPARKLLQEVTTRWWSILLMLISIVNSNEAVTLALSKSNKIKLILSPTELKEINEIIALLQGFKDRTDQLGSEKDVTITFITPVFRYFENFILVINEHDSLMIKELPFFIFVEVLKNS
ncbi:MAG: hypothetical protein GY775_20965 [Candidatus Scalindua sp.]|nr:hypothetical protein [Candidatus Scalindua sp.]